VLLLCLAGASSSPGAETLTQEEMLRRAGAAAGVAVQVACGEGALLPALAQSGRLVLHALEADPARVAKAREALRTRGLYGQVTVMRWASSKLPYAENLVNLLVVSKGAGVADAELTRVLAPYGAAFIEEKSGWRVLEKAWPASFDEWTHPRHGADGNMVSRDRAVKAPVGVRWVAGPAQDSGGRKWYFDHALVTARGRSFYLQEDALTARDAFNGVLLWSRPVKPAVYRERGAPVPPLLQAKTKLGTRTTRVKPIVSGNALYVATDKGLAAWDVRSGETLLDYGPVKGPRLLLAEGPRLIVACSNQVAVFELASTRLLWRRDLEPEQVVAADGTVFCVAPDSVLALAAQDGAVRWQSRRARTEASATCTVGPGALLLEESSWRDDKDGCRVAAYATTDGKLLWERLHRPGQTHYQETRSFFAGNLVLLPAEGRKVVGLDPLTGREVRTWKSGGRHCATPVATEHYFIAPECDFTDLESGLQTHARMFKSACRLPFIPANGLLNSFPVQCECYPMLRGYMGLSPTEAPTLRALRRFDKGPAFDRSAAAPVALDGEWPTYRYDTHRSGATPAALRLGDTPQVLWSVQAAALQRSVPAQDWDENPFLSGPLTALTAAQGLVFVAAADEHRVAALDAVSGQARWTFTAGGRIDTPPTVQDGLCLFGSHDGWVYCLEAASGRLAWRFRAAPSDALMMAYGQMESPWPAPGSILVRDGVAYFAAGRHPCSDTGVRVFAARARTGDLLWEKVLDALPFKDFYSPMLPSRKKAGLDFEPVDMLVSDGDAVAMSRWRFEPASGKHRLLLESIEYSAGELPVPRGLWGYGIRQNKSVLPKPPVCFDQTQIYLGTTNDVALILAGGQRVSGSASGEVSLGARTFQLESPPVRDGLIAAYGRLYAATRAGKVVCVK